MTCVKAQRNWRAVLFFHAPNGRKNDELLTHELRRVPSHASVLGHPEVVATGLFDQELGSKRNRTFRSVSVSLNFTCRRVGTSAKYISNGNFCCVVVWVDT